MRLRALLLVCAVTTVWGIAPTPPVLAQTTSQIPVPRPFPQPNQPSTQPPASSKPSTPDPTPVTRPETPPATAPAAAPPAPSLATARPTEQQLGVAVYPAADYIDAYDAGPGERIYLFGTNATYAEIVAYFRNTPKD